MIIGVLGKGGTGKSTVSTLLIRALARRGLVLGVDADHNMDLTYNFGNPSMRYIAETLPDAKEVAGINRDQPYRTLFENKEVPQPFSLDPMDTYTSTFSVPVGENIYLMSAGPQTDAVLHDETCSHTLSTSLKMYLPLLSMKKDQFVVVDEKAGADGVTTGIVSGFDCVLIVCEPAEHGVKVANQIAEYVEFFGTPYEFVVNKYREDSPKNSFLSALKKEPLFTVPLALDPLEEQTIADEIIEKLVTVHGAASTRIERTRTRLERNISYKNLET